MYRTSSKIDPQHRWLHTNIRPFRQKFCQLARHRSGLSLEELAERLNSHAEVLALKSYPCFQQFYPITPELLSNLENDIQKIFEYCSQGFLFGGIGIPTDKIAGAIASVCGVNSHYKRFESWCYEIRFGTDPQSRIGKK